MRAAALLPLLLLLDRPAMADFAYGPRRLAGTSFTESGQVLRFPFFGGQYATLHQLVDIDGDKDLDLFLQLETGRLLFFENAGGPLEPDFRWNESLDRSLAMGNWFYFLDADRDGDYDLAASPDGGTLSLRINEGGPRSPRFGPPRGPLASADGAPLAVNVLEDMNFADVDCDGDEDLFAASTLGTVRFYENTGALKDGAPVFKEGREGYQGFDYSQPLGKQSAETRKAKEAHGSLNTSTWVDIDQDGDLDLVYGDFYDSGMTVAVNAGTCKEPRFQKPIQLAGPGIINTAGGNLARFGDLDGDGLPDLVVSNLMGARSAELGQKNDLLFYRNAGAEEGWRFERMAGAPFSGLDVGAYSTAQLADIDGDGDRDLLMTNKIDTGAFPRSGLFFFRNTGTPERPAYEKQEQGFLRLADQYAVALAFGDLDGDSDLDLLTGNFTGTLCLYENAGTRAEPDFRAKDTLYMGIDAGQKSVPALADLDGDGDLDLLVGEARGIVKFYRNAGSRTEARFTLEENKFQDIQGPVGAAIALGDVDGDGDADLVIGGESLTAQLWINTGGKSQPRFASALALESPFFFTPAFGDADADGDLDLFGGSLAGGLVLFENTGTVPFAIPNAVRPAQGARRAPTPFLRAGTGSGIWRISVPGRGTFDAKGVLRKEKKP